MILVDEALRRRAERADPIRVAMFGAGFMARGVAYQLLNVVPGMRLVGITNRSVERARVLLADAGAARVTEVASIEQAEAAIAAGATVVTDDPSVLTRADGVDAIIEVTGAVEYGANVALDAIEHGRHVVLMNAEVDATVGPILARYAAQRGVVLTGCDGDQPAVQMNLVRFVRSIGLEPRLCGNVKGLHDPYRTPATQAAFAQRWGQSATMVTSFADGTKVSFEQALVANATGMTVAQRGMLGLEHSGHIDETVHRYDPALLERLGGIVEYVVGARPGPGVFVLATHDDAGQRHYLELYKLGTGPLYSFYTPYHLCHFEAPFSIARAVEFGDAAIRPLGTPRVDVVAVAKRDIPAGTRLDGIGGFDTYGVCERAAIAARERLLPMGVAEGCSLTRAVARDSVLTYDDVRLPSGRLVDRLRLEQSRALPPSADP